MAERKPLPPLKGVAGLGNVLADAKRGINEVRQVTTALSSETADLVRDVNIMRDHVRQVHEDLHFEASTLGNGGPSLSEEPSEQSEKQVEEDKPQVLDPLGHGQTPPAAS